MGLFKRQIDDGAETSRRYLERAPRQQRKDLLAIACLNQIMGLPIAQADQYGTPIADVQGLGGCRKSWRVEGG